MSGMTPASITEPFIRQVLLCDLLERRPRYMSTAHSLPGHLIQLTIEGETEHVVEGRRYQLRPGSLLWYNEVEQVKVRVIEGRWRFYTCNFIAEAIEAPPFDERVKTVRPAVEERFANLLNVWRNMALAPVIRHLQVHAAMASLLGEVLEDFDHIPSQSVEMPALARLWWEVEAKVRKRVGQPLTLPELAELSDRSQATLARACHAAVGMAPMKRLKHIRMNLAQGLLYRSDLSIKEVSARLGYDRLHEFSRDYRKHFGTSPRHDREQHHAINAP